MRGSAMLRECARLGAAKDDVGVEVLEEFAHVQVSHLGLTWSASTAWRRAP